MTSSRHQSFARPVSGARLVSVGTATPSSTYTQQQILEWAHETDPKIERLFRNSHIAQRHLYLTAPVDGGLPDETNQELIDKHLRGVLDIGPQAIPRALAPLGLAPTDVDFFLGITSTGLLCPGITAHIIRAMGFRDDVKRADIVGMGCNAAMNGLQLMTGWCQTQPGRIGVMLCVEICSAAYTLNRSLSTAVVNSLFGDGAGAVVIRSDARDGWADGPVMAYAESFILTDAIDAMKYELDGSKLSFFLERNIPYVIGEHVSIPVTRLLGRHGLEVSDIDHWMIHSGGKKVIDAIAQHLALPDHAVRHTRSILHDYGNMSSSAVLFSFDELRREGVIKARDLGVMIAMGPGTSIEAALLAW